MATPATARGVAIARILTGVIFVAEGVSKIRGEFVRGGFAESVRETAGHAWPFWASFLRSTVLHCRVPREKSASRETRD